MHRVFPLFYLTIDCHAGIIINRKTTEVTVGDMDDLSHRGVIQALLKKHGFTFSKALGQNFLVNPSVCPRIAKEGGAEGNTVLEIGTGIGVLTTELARLAKKVIAVELDERLFPILEETLSEFFNIKLIHGDILKLPLADILKEECGNQKVAVCANLPYYITSPVLMHLLESRLPISSITVMVQKEAAERICAKPGTREAGAISLACWYYAQPKRLFSVSRGSFCPAPKVDSVVIRLDVREKPAVAVPNEADLFGMIRAGFSQRRKMISSPLSSYWGCSKEEAKARLQKVGISPSARAEELTLEQFATLCQSEEKQ